MGDKKVPLILFSGGLDSSHMLEEMLAVGDVETLYVIGGQAPDKVIQERVARNAIMYHLEKRTGNKVLKDHEVRTNQMFVHMADHMFQQPAMWITGALQVSDANKHSELLIGYVAGDQISCKIPYIQQAWDYLQLFSKVTPIPVRFPLQLITKLEILDRISSHVVGKVWVCEMPHEKERRLVACKCCTPCLTMAATLHAWKLKHGEHYSKRVISALNYPVGELLPTDDCYRKSEERIDYR
jgi:7-cyano-7-deazaguanine synthase in queuosine biosynthesis